MLSVRIRSSLLNKASLTDSVGSVSIRCFESSCLEFNETILLFSGQDSHFSVRDVFSILNKQS